VARYGGDEFVAIFPETALQAGVEWADEVRRTIGDNTFLSREWGFNNPPLNLEKIITASIGVAQYVPDVKTPLSIEQEKSDLVRRADAAMYRAKSLGKNKVVISRAGGEFVVSG
jgi:diguanylate cyclase (GGDEF)-like protein